MQFFLDTAEISEIEEIMDLGILDGITTNPSIIAKSGKDFKTVLKEICNIVPGPVSAEVIATDYNNMIKEGLELREIADNIVIKLPVTWDGIKACKYLANQDIKVNMTLCFSANQALIAAKAGASYISPFIGRLEDIGQEGIELIRQIREIYSIYVFDTQILAASIRNTDHIFRVASLGADVATMPYKVLKQLIKHPLTDIGLNAFLKDWAASSTTKN